MIDQVLAWGNLRLAWQQVEANKGAPGVDEVTLKRWGRNRDANLERLRHQVRTNTYRPSRPRRFKALKKDGTYRELSILTVTDRVLQRATLNALENVCEKRFLNCSFGYRPNRSVANAVTAVVRQRERGRRWLLDADIDDCFDSLDHSLIIELAQQVVSDAVVRGLIAAWLKAGAKRSRIGDRGSLIADRSQIRNPRSKIENPKSAVGVPLGAVISPLLCNLVLHELDAALTRAGWALVRYADDFVVLTRTETEAQAAQEDVEAALAGLRLKLNPAKTRLTSFDAGFRFLGVEFQGDTYSYVHQNKRIAVTGPNTRILYRHQPEFY